MDELIKLILQHKGKSTDYRIVIKGVQMLPLGVELEVQHLPSSDRALLVVP